MEATRPTYLLPGDRVLFLDNSGNDQYWLIKQGVFWSEPYAEAFALSRRGDSFLRDRTYFYALLDRVESSRLREWLEQRGVTLMIDRREGGDACLAQLNEQASLGMRKIVPGVLAVRQSGSAKRNDGIGFPAPESQRAMRLVCSAQQRHVQAVSIRGVPANISLPHRRRIIRGSNRASRTERISSGCPSHCS